MNESRDIRMSHASYELAQLLQGEFPRLFLHVRTSDVLLNRHAKKTQKLSFPVHAFKPVRHFRFCATTVQ